MLTSSLNKLNTNFFYSLLFSPLLAYIYKDGLGLPKYFNHPLVFVVVAYGLYFLSTKQNIRLHLFTKYILIFSIYRMLWQFLISQDKHYLTNIFYHLLYYANFFIILIVYNTRFDDKFIEKSISLIKITVICALIGSIAQVFDPSFLEADLSFGESREAYDASGSIYTYRRSSIFGYIFPLSTGLSFLPLVSVLTGFMLLKKDKNYIFYLLASGLVALLSNTRFVMICFVVLTFQILVFNKHILRGSLKYFFLAVLGIFLLSNMLQYLGYDFRVWKEERLFVEGEIKSTTRVQAINTFKRFFPKRPIFGSGTLTPKMIEASHRIGSSQIHVGYLQMLVLYGVVGCFFLFGFWYLLLRKLYKTAKLTNYWGSFFAFLVFLVAFSTHTHPSIFFYGLIFSFIFDKYYMDKYLKSVSAQAKQNITT